MMTPSERTKKWRKMHPEQYRVSKNAWQHKNKDKQRTYHRRWYRKHMGKPAYLLPKGKVVTQSRREYYQHNKSNWQKHKDVYMAEHRQYVSNKRDVLEYHRAIHLIVQASSKKALSRVKQLRDDICKNGRPDMQEAMDVAELLYITPVMKQKLSGNSIRMYYSSARKLVDNTDSKTTLLMLYGLIQKKLKKI